MSYSGWVEFNGGLIVRFPDKSKNEPSFTYNERVLAFNLDDTLIKAVTKLTNVKQEYEFVFPNCINKMLDFWQMGYSLVVISDQESISKGIMSIEDLQHKFNFLVKSLSGKSVPIMGIFTTKYNCYRKPHTWTWKFLTQIYLAAKRTINLRESIYTGNLAGRVAKYPLRKDQSYCDRAYAFNIGIQFKVPEQIFRLNYDEREYAYEGTLTDKEKDEFIDNELNKYKQTAIYNYKNLYLYCVDISNAMSPIKTLKPSFMIIMIGAPCSGKTKLATLIASHAIINTDAKPKSHVVIMPDYYYRNEKKMSSSDRMKAITNFIQDGRVIILDGNYPSHESREPYLAKAAEYKMPVLFLKLNTPYKICKQFNYIKLEKSQDRFRSPLSDFQFKAYNKRYQKPDINAYARQYPGLVSMIIEVPTIIIPSIKEFRYIY